MYQNKRLDLPLESTTFEKGGGGAGHGNDWVETRDLPSTGHGTLALLSCDQQVLREGPFPVDPLAIAAESRAGRHL